MYVLRSKLVSLYLPLQAIELKAAKALKSAHFVNWVVSFGSSIYILVCLLFAGLSVAIPIQIHF